MNVGSVSAYKPLGERAGLRNYLSIQYVYNALYSSTSKHKLDLAAALSHPLHYFLSMIKKEPFMII